MTFPPPSSVAVADAAAAHSLPTKALVVVVAAPMKFEIETADSSSEDRRVSKKSATASEKKMASGAHS